MSKHIIPPYKSLQSDNSKDNSRLTQLQTIFLFLQHHIATASMVAEATGVPQKNICRYKRDLQKEGRLWEASKGICKHTGFKAWYLTTDKSKIKQAMEGLINE